ITFECWPYLADPSRHGTQFPGWPVTVNQLDNYGRRPAGFLPRLLVRGAHDPVVQVSDESSGEIIYTLRIKGRDFQPPVYTPGRYRVTISDPDAGRTKAVGGLGALARNPRTLEVDLSDAIGKAP